MCGEHDISKGTFYNWCNKYGGLKSIQVKHLKDFEPKNQRLKRMYADLSLDSELIHKLNEVAEKLQN